MESNKLIYPLIADDITETVIYTFLGTDKPIFDYKKFTSNKYLG